MFDVVVVGGGPAGSAVAGALGRRGRSVALLERTNFESFRAGETLDAETFPLLESLGAWDRVASVTSRQVPHRGVRSAWGSEELEDRPSIFHPLGEGRHVDRARFDEALAAWASSAGAIVRLNVGTCAVRTHGEFFRVEPARGEPIDARYFVDASGRGAPASARLGGRRWLAVDRQVALVARMQTSSDLGFDLWLEAARDGWWYSVPQADGAFVVALITDADLLASGGRRANATRFAEALARTKHTAARCAVAKWDALDSSLRIVRAESGVLMRERGDDWCAVGDAAMATDPLAGNGVARALRGAMEAVERIDARLRGETPATYGPDPRKFFEYLDRRADYYEIEARWPTAPFWMRRRPGAWREVPITLAPTAILERSAKPTRATLAPVEALVPPRAIASMLASMEENAPAHVFLSRLRDAAPLGDRRLLVGLQLLVQTGVLRERRQGI